MVERKDWRGHVDEAVDEAFDEVVEEEGGGGRRQEEEEDEDGASRQCVVRAV